MLETSPAAVIPAQTAKSVIMIACIAVPIRVKNPELEGVTQKIGKRHASRDGVVKAAILRGFCRRAFQSQTKLPRAGVALRWRGWRMIWKRKPRSSEVTFNWAPTCCSL